MPPAPRIRVSVVVRDGAGRLLLAEQHKAGRRHWLIPGGGVEHGETLMAAAARELREETGLDVVVGRLAMVSEVIEAGGRHHLELVFLCEGHTGEVCTGSDDAVVGLQWHDPDALPALPLHPPIGSQLLAAIRAGFDGPVRMLGNVFRPDE